MGRVAGDGAGETPGMPGSDALEALRWHWGDAYAIETTREGWRARRRDGLGSWITAPNAVDLRDRILTDYLAKPVPRPPAEH